MTPMSIPEFMPMPIVIPPAPIIHQVPACASCCGPDLASPQGAHALGWMLLIVVIIAAWIGVPIFVNIRLNKPPLLTRAQTWAWYVVPFTGLLVYLFTR